MIQDLRRHVERRSNNRLKDSIIPIIQIPSEPKITDLELAIGDEYVGWFEIAMHDIHLIHVLKPSHDILQK